RRWIRGPCRSESPMRTSRANPRRRANARAHRHEKGIAPMSESIDSTELNDENETSTPAPAVAAPQEALDDGSEADETLASDEAPADDERATDDRRGRTKRNEDSAPDIQAAEALRFVGDVVDKMDMRCTVHRRRPREEAELVIRLEK